MRFIHILSPCPPGWIYSPEKTIHLARLAVLSRIFPLVEVKDGRDYTVTPTADKVPVSDYIQSQGRFRALSDEDIAAIQKNVDQAWSDLMARGQKQGRRTQ